MGPVSKVGTLVAQEALGHEADAGRLVDGDGLEAGRVEGGGARPVAFGGAPEAVWLKLARRRSLATEVHGPEGEVGVELVPPQ